MATRPEENPFVAARRREDETKKKARGQLVDAAAASRADIQAARRAGEADDERLVRAGGKAFAGARSRTPGGIAALSGLGSLTMDTAGRRSEAAARSADRVAAQRRKAEQDEQKVTAFDIESQKSVDELRQERQNLDDELKRILEANPGNLGIGEDEEGMAQDILEWARDTMPTEAEFNRMWRMANDRYGVSSRNLGPGSQSEYDDVLTKIRNR
jgi:hypothetical protein